ncbi:MAG: methyltransferase domain-containing protein [Deltaproteobacteria bacterium]|nr:MAG: methyltransferase domain-containing protein [Deltaproteobacteria bacterium]
MQDLGALERYRDLVDDWPAFREACLAPLPPVVWANPLRSSAEAVCDLLDAAGWAPTPLAWYPGAFRLRPGARPGGTLWHRAGLYQIQEEVSLLPPVLLDPQAGERILDACAAPGNKTAQIAVRMGDVGTVVANDRDAGRIRSLRAVVERLGLCSVVLTQADAANLPLRGGRYDRILCDVPCSGEGTSRKSRGAFSRSRKMAQLGRSQRAILRKAVRLSRPGGRIVYSTCTYAPEENEAVVDEILAEGGVRVVPAAVEGLVTRPGLTEWKGRRYHPSLRGAMRVYPHLNDTGGFFVCLLERSEAAEAIRADPVGPEAIDRGALEALRERFGLPPDLFAPYALVRGSRMTLALLRRSAALPAAPEPVSLGLPLCRAEMVHPKPTTAGAMWLGPHATRNVVDLRPEEVDRYLRRAPLALDTARTRPLDRGFVLVRYQGWVLGAAFYPGEGAPLDSQYPKAWALREGESALPAAMTEQAAQVSAKAP